MGDDTISSILLQSSLEMRRKGELELFEAKRLKEMASGKSDNLEEQLAELRRKEQYLVSVSQTAITKTMRLLHSSHFSLIT